MLDDEPSQRFTAIALACLLAFSLFTAGCATDDGPEGDDNDGDPPASEDECQSQSGTSQGSSGAQVACRQATGPATHTQAFDCPSPDRSALSLGTNTTAGSLTVRLMDAGDSTLFEETYEQRGEHNDTQTINEGEAGEWTLEAERSDDFEGGFGVQAACAQ